MPQTNRRLIIAELLVILSLLPATFVCWGYAYMTGEERYLLLGFGLFVVCVFLVILLTTYRRARLKIKGRE